MVTKRAILIGCAGGYRGLAFLRGVALDLKNYEKFLKSPAGGEWRTDEIITLYEPNVFEIKKVISDLEEDYVFVVFCGHGSIKAYDKFDFICAKDENLSILELKSKSKKQTIILDANRSPVVRLHCNSIESLLVKSISGKQTSTRELFNQAIMEMPQGILLVFSAQAGQIAGDDEECGGHFTYALLRVGLEWRNDLENRGIMRIDTAIAKAEFILKEECNSAQQPLMAGQVRRLTFPPFAVANS